jgi:4,4'-diapophytoene synthase
MNNWWLYIFGAVSVIIIIYYLQLPIAYWRCEQIIKKNSYSFYKAFSLIDEPDRRRAVYAVYAFCRLADDIVDEKRTNYSLDKLEAQLTAFVKSNQVSTFIFRALSDVRKKFYKTDYDFKPFYLMISGQRMDLDFKRIQTVDQLLNYCYLVAGSVGLMLIPILAKKPNKKAEQFAIDLGQAFQITNILRDVGEDYRINRVYLPTELLLSKNYKLSDLKNGKINKEFKAVFETLATLAEAGYSKVLKQLGLFHKSAQLPLGSAIVIYREILNRCRISNYDVFSKKNFVPDSDKIRLIKDLKKKLKE